MADLYGLNCHDSSHESEDMSSFLHNLLQGSSAGPSSASPFSSFKNVHSFSPPPPVELGYDVASGAGVFRSSVTVTSFPSDSDFRFSDLGGSDGSSSMKMNFPPEDDVAEDFDFCYEVHNKASEDVSGSTGVPRSSKRTRAAEIHNLSEKRRRSRINEKLKALQTLIPNSNKTDKASMLDDAIEYLKQLQLQVQMLTRRNGLSLRPAYVREQYQPIQRGVEYDDEVRLINPNGGGTFSLNQEISLRREFDIPNYTLTNPQTGLPSLTNIAKSEAPFGLESSAHN